MKKPQLICFLILGLMGFAFAWSVSQTWELTETFSVKFVNPEATGSFTKMTANIVFDEANLQDSKFEAVIDVNSIDMGNPDLNKQALSADMLYARRYPKIQFTSTEVSRKGTGFVAKGMLDLHGVKKETEIPFTFQGKVFTGGFEIKAKDFGINSLGNGAEDILKIELLIPVKEKKG
jgi:polyisoprenoid-binding protein YceI